jgi:phenylacetate-CoA ligase
MCRFAAAKTPFYQDRLNRLFGPGEEPDGRFTMEHWTDVEPVRRNDLIARAGEFYVPPSDELGGAAGVIATSGSTGEPVSLRVSGQQAVVTTCMHMRRYHVDPDATSALITRPLYGEPLGHAEERRGWHAFTKGGLQFDVRAKIHEQVEWLLNVRARYLATFSSVAAALARFVLEKGIRDLRFELVFTQSDRLSSSARREIETAFGARVIDSYGAEEAGQLAFECRFGSLHVNDEAALVEIVDEDNQPVGEGKEGRVLVTPFYNFATPLVRYDIGDFAVRGALCRCGRGLGVIAGLLGRRRNILRFSDGTLAWLSVNSFKQQVDFPYRLIQFVQTAPDHIEINYVPTDRDPPIDGAACQRALRAILHPTLTVTLVKRDDIPRGRGGKLDETVSLVKG